MPQKVFCIGFHKTGTSSMNQALSRLGYRVHGPMDSGDCPSREVLLERAIKLAHRYDAFEDNPWPIFFRELHQEFPNSKFILTVRDSRGWLTSVLKHFGHRSTPMRELIYGKGSPVGNEDIYLQRYRAHNSAVIQHFQDSPEHLLVLDVSASEPWRRLCDFLGQPIPLVSFPHANAATNRTTKKPYLIRSLVSGLMRRK
jgi:hypothetical protein